MKYKLNGVERYTSTTYPELNICVGDLVYVRPGDTIETLGKRHSIKSNGSFNVRTGKFYKYTCPERRYSEVSHHISDWTEFDKGYFWRRDGELMFIVYPPNKVFKMPDNYYIDTSKMPENPYGASFNTKDGLRAVKVPIIGWALKRAEYEPVFFVDNLKDSHSAEHDNKYTIPVDGEYLYQVKGLRPTSHKFKAGDTIPYKLVFLFKIGGI